MNRNTPKYNKGFTIIETLVAVAILMISIVGPLTIAHKGLLAAVYAHDQVTASYLAQDAFEYIKAMRDATILFGNSWLSNIPSECQIGPGSVCSVDTVTGRIRAGTGFSSCSGSSCALGVTTAGYYPRANPMSRFTRYFYLTSNAAGSGMILTVVVKWTNGTVNNQVTYEDQLFNISK